ncbi:nuclear transport factor 2 family protein [Mariniflexile ostreae]|uniref:Nuclear transport factor 2 family protein n=1 Tax=Mariniflexile ostreae TaxID=1520892 RepID=A0ABV5F8Z4_9FLAO
MNSVKKITEEFLDYLGKRDLNNLISLFSENIEWEIPGNVEKVDWLGKRSSKDEIKKKFEMLWSATEPLSVRINKIFMEDDEAVIAGAFSTRMLKTNKIVDSIFFIHMVVKDQKIIKYTLLEDSYAVSEALI